jgi:hypothetical protein
MTDAPFFRELTTLSASRCYNALEKWQMPVRSFLLRKGDVSMDKKETRLFVGIKISSKLQRELDNCASGAKHYLAEDRPESLQIVTLGENKIIGRFLPDGFPVRDIDNVSRNVCSIVTRMTQGSRIAEDAVHIYADSTVPVSLMSKEQSQCSA